ncbi:epidermal differentiation-specific protein-like [Leptodactylus fuscus]|uniref:epidermal differentiation-specific protein-like n=1 Tax=Leptodactylus fuscus TaxID=238119 RepID=UPI003F4F209F
MSTLKLFESPNFNGESLTLDCDTPDLSENEFLQKAQSLKVRGDPWIVFSGANYDYMGMFGCFPQGDYSTIPEWAKKISSARIVRGGLSHPKITLHEDADYKGKLHYLEKASTSVKSFGFDNKALSQKEVSGAWILYSEDKCSGKRMITVAGEDIPNYEECDWREKVRSLKPVTPDRILK